MAASGSRSTVGPAPAITGRRFPNAIPWPIEAFFAAAWEAADASPLPPDGRPSTAAMPLAEDKESPVAAIPPAASGLPKFCCQIRKSRPSTSPSESPSPVSTVAPLMKRRLRDWNCVRFTLP